MNHLIKIVNFYKIKKESDVKAIKYYFDMIDKNYFIYHSRIVKTSNFYFIFFKKTLKKINYCPICIDNIYNNKYLKIIPIYLYNRYFFIQPSYKQYINMHLVIIDLIHIPHEINENTINYLFSFIEQFPSFFICANTNLKNIGGSVNEHLHYQAGISDMPLFHKDASLIEDDIYLVDWYLTTYLIKSSDKELIKEKYNHLLSKHQDEFTSFNPILFSRNEIYYLYLILRCAEEINQHLVYKDFKEGKQLKIYIWNS